MSVVVASYDVDTKWYAKSCATDHIESASRPPCGFWRIDDQQLEV
jgi:hypothetical protein